MTERRTRRNVAREILEGSEGASGVRWRVFRQLARGRRAETPLMLPICIKLSAQLVTLSLALLGAIRRPSATTCCGTS